MSALLRKIKTRNKVMVHVAINTAVRYIFLLSFQINHRFLRCI